MSLHVLSGCGPEGSWGESAHSCNKCLRSSCHPGHAGRIGEPDGQGGCFAELPLRWGRQTREKKRREKGERENGEESGSTLSSCDERAVGRVGQASPRGGSEAELRLE